MRAAAILLLCWASSAFAGTTDDGIPDARYVEYGSTFSSYTARVTTIALNGEIGFGSCVMIRDSWALTAAHVVKGSAAVVVMSGTRSWPALSFHPHEAFEDVHAEHDIALVRVCRPFGMDWYPPLGEAPPKPGAVVCMAGYGSTGRLSQGYSRTDHVLRGGTAVVGGEEKHMIVCPARRGGSALPFCIAPGDSGGPMFSDGRLVGVASCIMAKGGRAKARVGDESGHTNVTRFREWIDTTIAKVESASP
jgi:hypothetical protein